MVIRFPLSSAGGEAVGFPSLCLPLRRWMVLSLATDNFIGSQSDFCRDGAPLGHGLEIFHLAPIRQRFSFGMFFGRVCCLACVPLDGIRAHHALAASLRLRTRRDPPEASAVLYFLRGRARHALVTLQSRRMRSNISSALILTKLLFIPLDDQNEQADCSLHW